MGGKSGAKSELHHCFTLKVPCCKCLIVFKLCFVEKCGQGRQFYHKNNNCIYHPGKYMIHFKY